jgi:WW domain-binding protein 2
MALNWTMLDAHRSPVPLPHELIIRTVSAADVSLTIPNAPPTAGSSSGGAGGEKIVTATGKIWLTDNRVRTRSPAIARLHLHSYHQLIFVANQPQPPAKGSESNSFDSLSVPLASILSTKFEQPFFGQNFLVVEIKPANEGGLTTGTKAEIRLKDKGLFEFVSVLEKTRERAIYMKRASADEEEGLRMYLAVAVVRLSLILCLIHSWLFYPIEHGGTVRCQCRTRRSTSGLRRAIIRALNGECDPDSLS